MFDLPKKSLSAALNCRPYEKSCLSLGEDPSVVESSINGGAPDESFAVVFNLGYDTFLKALSPVIAIERL